MPDLIKTKVLSLEKSFHPLLSDKALCIIKSPDSLLHEIEDP